MKKLLLYTAIYFSGITANAQWTMRYTAPESLMDMFCLDENHCYAVGFNSTVIKTVDGSTWELKNNGISPSIFLRNIFCTDQNTCYIAASDNNIYKTTNGANSWQEYGPVYNTGELFFVNDSVGYVSGIYKTTDAGATWTQLISQYFPAIFFTSENIGYGSGGASNPDRAVIYKLNVVGNKLTKTKVFEDTTIFSVLDIFFVNDSTGYASTGGFSSSKILKTINSGQSWTKLKNPLLDSVGGFHKVKFVDANKGYAIGVKNGRFYIVKTEDGGLTWSEETVSGGKCQPPYANIFINGNKGITFGCSYIYVNDSTGFGTGIKNILTQNHIGKIYPNPLTTHAYISITNNINPSGFSFELYDITGRKLREIALNAPTVEFEREDLESGMYIYKITNNTEIIASGKIIIN